MARGETDAPNKAAIDDAEKQPVELLAGFDEPIAPQEYPLALLALGQRTRTLFLGFRELNVGRRQSPPAPCYGRCSRSTC